MHAHYYTDGVTWSEGREGAKGDEKGVGVGVGNGVGKGDGNGDGAETGTWVREQPQHGDGGGTGHERMSPRQERGRERDGGTGAKAGRGKTMEKEGREMRALVSTTSGTKQSRSPGTAIPHEASYL